MSKRKNKKNNEEFEDIFADGSLNEEFEDIDDMEEDGLFDDDNFTDQYGDEEQNVLEGTEEQSNGILSSVGNTVGNVANLAKENKLATAGILGAVGFGLWKFFGSEEKQENSQQGSQNQLPQSYEDEFLGLDDEDSIDDFLEEHSNQKINPMFTPLRFK